jgi:hypothetical protein
MPETAIQTELDMEQKMIYARARCPEGALPTLSKVGPVA